MGEEGVARRNFKNFLGPSLNLNELLHRKLSALYVLEIGFPIPGKTAHQRNTHNAYFHYNFLNTRDDRMLLVGVVEVRS
jgi:hypothetical protein